jgi:hypothetical protein
MTAGNETSVGESMLADGASRTLRLSRTNAALAQAVIATRLMHSEIRRINLLPVSPKCGYSAQKSTGSTEDATYSY